MAMNGIYNYNNFVMGSKKYNSPNENGINMALVAKGRLYESFESKGEKYYGVSYTAQMQRDGKIGIPDESVPGGYKVVDVDSDEGEARLAELEKERSAAIAELKKYNDFINPANAGKTPAATVAETVEETKAKTDSGVINEVKHDHDHKHNKHNRWHEDREHSGTYTKRGTLTPDADEVRSTKDGMKNNVSAFKKMVYAHAKAQAQHAGKAGGKNDLKDMLGDVSKITPEEAQSAISEDGEWGVKKTAQRLLDFAVALSGGDPSKIDTLRDAVRKGFSAAEKAWGGTLPGISYDTLQRVMEGFDEWERTGSAEAAQALLSA